MTRVASRRILAGAATALLTVSTVGSAPPGPGAAAGDPATFPPTVPDGFAVQPAATVPTPTSLAFSPDGQTLYVTSPGTSALLPGPTGMVIAFPVLGGVALGPPVVFMALRERPLGVLATEDGVFVSVLIAGGLGERGTGAVLRARDANGDRVADSLEPETVIGNLPVGRHNTNGMAIGPDGMLYIANGNSNDSGFGDEGGEFEIRPYSGSLLRVDPTATGLTPQPSMVAGTGWRNIFDVAFAPPGHPSLPPNTAAVPMNGPDGETYDGIERPAAEDTLSLLDPTDDVVEHFGFPWCLYDRDNGGLKGFDQDETEGRCHPLPATAREGLEDSVQPSRPVALFGKHVSADGLAFNPGTNFPPEMRGDLFVCLFGNFFGDQTVGHKIVRVTFSQSSQKVAAIENFMTGALPLDVTFGPDGAMWVADFSGHILRVSAAP